MIFKHFKISSPGEVSQAFIKRGIKDFNQALSFIKELPYARNKNKKDLLTVFTDGHGTCSTKHALLKMLATENKLTDIQLILGLFKMNAANSPLVKETLEKYKLEYIPEAHNYLRYKGEMIDVTKATWNQEAIEKVLLEEIEIHPDQITNYKVGYHKNFLQKWLTENKIPYTLDELWLIREQCIQDLSN